MKALSISDLLSFLWAMIYEKTNKRFEWNAQRTLYQKIN